MMATGRPTKFLRQGHTNARKGLSRVVQNLNKTKHPRRKKSPANRAR